LRRGRLVVDDRTMPRAFQYRTEAATFVNRENDYRDVVLPRKGNRGRIHDRQALAKDAVVAEAIVADRIAVLARIGRIDAVDQSPLEKGVRADLGGAQRGG